MPVVPIPGAAPDYAVCYDPATAALVATIGGSVIGAVGAIQQGRAAQTAANFQARVLEQRAERERQIAEAEATDFRRDARRILAQQRARAGGSGITFEGTPLLVAQDTAAEAELQALRILSGGETNELRLRQQAGLERLGGRQARQQSFFRAGSTLLSGASQAFGQRADR